VLVLVLVLILMLMLMHRVDRGSFDVCCCFEVEARHDRARIRR
jgi:hypothetical protein